MNWHFATHGHKLPKIMIYLNNICHYPFHKRLVQDKVKRILEKESQRKKILVRELLCEERCLTAFAGLIPVRIEFQYFWYIATILTTPVRYSFGAPFERECISIFKYIFPILICVLISLYICVWICAFELWNVNS